MCVCERENFFLNFNNSFIAQFSTILNKNTQISQVNNTDPYNRQEKNKESSTMEQIASL